MPFFNMFKSRRARSTSLPRAPERYLHESEVFNQPSAYGPRSGFGRSAHLAQPHAGYRAQRSSHGSSFSNSVPERYADSPTNDQSWYRVDHPDYSGYRDPRDRDPEEFSYSEEGDRHSDGTMSSTGVPIHTLSESTGTGIDSPVPTVHRQGSPQSGSRMYEQLARSNRAPASVTRLDLHEGIENGYDGGYDRRRRGAPPSARSNSLHRTASQNRQAYGAGTHRHGYHHPPHRQPSQHAFRGPTHVQVPTDSSRSASDVMQVMDNGDRVAIPRHPLERRRVAPRDSYDYTNASNNKRTYYVVPPGMSVIFRDEFGNELKRVGDFSGGGGDGFNTYDEAPVELTDELGRVVYKTGENYTEDGSEASEATYRPQVVHLGQYLSNGRTATIPRSTSPITISLDRRGYHRHIQLDPSEDSSFGGSQGTTDRSFSPPPSRGLSHTRSEGHLTGFGSMVRPHLDQVKLRTVYP